jgi:hypothetical protein
MEKEIGDAVAMAVPGIIVIRVIIGNMSQLAQIADALDHFGPFSGLVQGRQQHARQDRNDGNDDQELDQSKTSGRNRFQDGGEKRMVFLLHFLSFLL